MDSFKPNSDHLPLGQAPALPTAEYARRGRQLVERLRDIAEDFFDPDGPECADSGLPQLLGRAETPAVLASVRTLSREVQLHVATLRRRSNELTKRASKSRQRLLELRSERSHLVTAVMNLRKKTYKYHDLKLDRPLPGPPDTSDLAPVAEEQDPILNDHLHRENIGLLTRELDQLKEMSVSLERIRQERRNLVAAGSEHQRTLKDLLTSAETLVYQFQSISNTFSLDQTTLEERLDALTPELRGAYDIFSELAREKNAYYAGLRRPGQSASDLTADLSYMMRPLVSINVVGDVIEENVARSERQRASEALGSSMFLGALAGGRKARRTAPAPATATADADAEVDAEVDADADADTEPEPEPADAAPCALDRIASPMYLDLHLVYPATGTPAATFHFKILSLAVDLEAVLEALESGDPDSPQVRALVDSLAASGLTDASAAPGALAERLAQPLLVVAESSSLGFMLPVLDQLLERAPEEHRRGAPDLFDEAGREVGNFTGPPGAGAAGLGSGGGSGRARTYGWLQRIGRSAGQSADVIFDGVDSRRTLARRVLDRLLERTNLLVGFALTSGLVKRKPQLQLPRLEATLDLGQARAEIAAIEKLMATVRQCDSHVEACHYDEMDMTSMNRIVSFDIRRSSYTMRLVFRVPLAPPIEATTPSVNWVVAPFHFEGEEEGGVVDDQSDPLAASALEEQRQATSLAIQQRILHFRAQVPGFLASDIVPFPFITLDAWVASLCLNLVVEHIADIQAVVGQAVRHGIRPCLRAEQLKFDPLNNHLYVVPHPVPEEERHQQPAGSSEESEEEGALSSDGDLDMASDEGEIDVYMSDGEVPSDDRRSPTASSHSSSGSSGDGGGGGGGGGGTRSPSHTPDGDRSWSPGLPRREQRQQHRPQHGSGASDGGDGGDSSALTGDELSLSSLDGDAPLEELYISDHLSSPPSFHSAASGSEHSRHASDGEIDD